MVERFSIMPEDEAIKLGLVRKPNYSRQEHTLVVENLPDGSYKIIGKDGGEPEDQLLYRDWDWVVPALNAAFEAGRASVKPV
jgi:hypothetical protein